MTTKEKITGFIKSLFKAIKKAGLKTAIITFSVLFIGGAIIFKVFSFDTLPSQVYGALIGVIITAIVTLFLLRGQSETEAERDKDIKIYEQKIRVYSEFIKQIWSIIDNEFTIDDLKKLRTKCFQELVFFLNDKQIENIAMQIKKIKPKADWDDIYTAMCEITYILQKTLLQKDTGSKEEITPGRIKTLIGSFGTEQKDMEEQPETDLKDSEEQIQIALKDTEHQKQEVSISEKQFADTITFWHFNMLGDQQLEAFKDAHKKNDSWVLNLNEYGEEWRTNKLNEVKKGDVVFLFRRGGYGYIGAFKVVGHKVLRAEEYSKKQYSTEDIRKYDLYNAMQDGATYSSNLIVEPIAYNFKGVGCKTVRRRTIEKFITDPVAVNYILDRLGDNPTYYPLNDEQKSGRGCLDKNIPVKISPVNKDFFNRLYDIDYINNHRKELSELNK